MQIRKLNASVVTFVLSFPTAASRRDKRRVYRFHRLAAMTLAMTWTTTTQEVLAQTTTWLGNTGSWFDYGNWSLLGGVPNGDIGARINNGGTAEILAPGANAESVELGSNSNHSGALAVRGGALQLRLTGGGLMRVGSFGAGTLTVLDGGSISGRTGQIGTGTLSTGTATVAGLGASWSNIERLFVGLGGTGTLDILRGGIVMNTVTSGIDTSATIGSVAGGNGTVNVDGLNSKFSNTKDLYIGDGGMGALNVTNRAQVTNFNGNLGVQSGSMGTVSVDGAGSLWKNDSVVAVGISGSGILNVTAGGAVSSTNGRIARESGSTGMVSVTGVGSSWTASGELSVGNSGAGTLTIQNGGRVTNFNGNIGVNGPIGIFSAAEGTVTVSGAGSQWINNSVVAVGVNGRGMLSILDGGRVQSTNGFIGRETGSAGTVLIDGPGSRWDVNGDLTMGLTGTGTASLEVRNGGVLSAAGIMMIGSRGTLRGDGTIATFVFNDGTVAPGTSAGTLRVDGNYAQSFEGTLKIDLASPSSFDKLAITGNMSLGGTLDVSLAPGYVPSSGAAFDILDFSNVLETAFAMLNLPALGGTRTWDTSQLYTTGVLSVIGPPSVEGDFNDDGKVDAADYVVWRRGLGTIYTQTDYDVWRAHFGQSVGSGAVDPLSRVPASAEPLSAAVPEPWSWVLFCLGFIAFAGPDRANRPGRRCENPSHIAWPVRRRRPAHSREPVAAAR